MCTHSVNCFYYKLPLRKGMVEGCKRKGMHKSMLWQLLNPENFSGHFRFWNSFIVNFICCRTGSYGHIGKIKLVSLLVSFIYIYRFFSIISLDKTLRYCGLTHPFSAVHVHSQVSGGLCI
jgi:hypothetical protein